MIYKTSEQTAIENLHGGIGKIILEKCEVHDHASFKLLVKVTVPTGGSIGHHRHTEDYEGYYILKGEGIFQDNDEESEVTAGDFCLISQGESHGMINTGKTDMVIMAIVMKD